MPEKTPGDRCRMLVDALIVWITLDRPLEPGINRFEVRGLQPRPGPWWPPPGERAAPTAHRLAAASLSANTRRAYSGALRRLNAWLAGRALKDATLAGYLAELHEQGRAPSSASPALAAARFRARLAGAPSPARERTGADPRGLPSDRRRARPGPSAPLRGGGPDRRPRQLPPASSSRPRRRVRRGRPEARPPRRGDRGAALHGGAAAERGERPPVGRQSPSLPPATGCW